MSQPPVRASGVVLVGGFALLGGAIAFLAVLLRTGSTFPRWVGYLGVVTAFAGMVGMFPTSRVQ